MNTSLGMNNKNGLSLTNYDGFSDCSSNNGFVQRYIYMPSEAAYSI